MQKKESYWNYRVIKMADKKLKGLPQSYSYGIYEVYYDKGEATSWSKDPMWAIGETWKELLEDYHLMFKAFTHSTLELKGNKLVEIGRFK